MPIGTCSPNLGMQSPNTTPLGKYHMLVSSLNDTKSKIFHFLFIELSKPVAAISYVRTPIWLLKELSFLFTTAHWHLAIAMAPGRAGHGCNTITPENIQPYYFLTPSAANKIQWLWVMWLDWLSSTSWAGQRLSCPPAPVSQTEEQYVSQQGCQTHPSQRWNMRVWPRENNSAQKPSSMTL